ncbi:replication-associated protein [Caerostris darwini]|uniref:Replication-associated protein n=1 Tax=Caerostris darwini TaxID=1538125 RepID=A0AAV4UBY4_9ARAC|nr:replication-associated protein [Caerostris darwini]
MSVQEFRKFSISQEAADYCKKDGNFKEFGRLSSIKQTANPFKDVLNAAERGEISTIKEEYPALYLRYKTYILSSVKFRTDELNGSCGVWICGPPRCASWRDHRTHIERKKKERENSALNPKAVENSTSRPKL